MKNIPWKLDEVPCRDLGNERVKNKLVLVDPKPNSPHEAHKHCMEDCEENYKWDLGSERVKYKLVLMSISLVQEDMLGLLLSGIPFLVYGILRKEKNLTVYLFAVPQN